MAGWLAGWLVEWLAGWLVESPMVSAASQVSLLRRHGSHSPGQLFSLSLVEVEDGWSRFSLSKAVQLIQQWSLVLAGLLSEGLSTHRNFR
jgi:hypothetical protein